MVKTAQDTLNKYKGEGTGVKDLFVNMKTELEAIAKEIEDLTDESIRCANILSKMALKPLSMDRVKFVTAMLAAEEKSPKRKESTIQKLKKMLETEKQKVSMIGKTSVDKKALTNELLKLDELDAVGKRI